MPALTMSETEDCQRRFQAAVDVIQNLPKNGSYKPSYEVMLRFYGLYKQAVCGPCTVSRPGFWDPVGRYKWDAWNRLGDMSCEKAMAAYVDEMKKVAQEVIDTMPVNEKTASFFHYFEPLYHVIHDMPRPPEALLTLRSDVITKELTDGLPQHDVERATQELISEEQDVIETVPDSEPHLETTALSDGQVLTSDSESEIFCDSLEQLDTVKGSGQSATNSGMKRRLFTIQSIPDGSNQLPGMPDSLQNWHIDMEKRVQEYQYTPVSQVTQVGAGHGGEGAEDRRGPPMRRRNTGREGMQQGWRGPSGYMAHRYGRWAERPASGAGSGGGGGDDGHDRLQDAQVQQQIILALRQLREDMQSVMERLEVVEGLATANAQNFQWRSHLQMTASETEEKWWPFDISGRTLLLLLVWPLVAQGLVFLLRRRKRKFHVSI